MSPTFLVSVHGNMKPALTKKMVPIGDNHAQNELIVSL